MKPSIVITLLAIFAILQACRAIPVRIHENNIDSRSPVAYLIPPVDNSRDNSELRNKIHSRNYPARFLNPFIYPYGSGKSINISPYLNHVVPGHARSHRPYPSPVVIPFLGSHPGDENLISSYPTTIGSSNESTSDSSDESISDSGQADEKRATKTTDENLLQSSTSTTTEPTCITITISTTEEPTTTVPISKSSEKFSSKASSKITEDSNISSNISSNSSQSSETLESADSSS